MARPVNVRDSRIDVQPAGELRVLVADRSQSDDADVFRTVSVADLARYVLAEAERLVAARGPLALPETEPAIERARLVAVEGEPVETDA